jgi:hypothetical protein
MEWRLTLNVLLDSPSIAITGLTLAMIALLAFSNHAFRSSDMAETNSSNVLRAFPSMLSRYHLSSRVSLAVVMWANRLCSRLASSLSDAHAAAVFQLGSMV